jgi:ribosomal protein S18 acetylase RimI-like enzyme
MIEALIIDPAQPVERAATLRLAFGHLPARDRDTRVNNALELVEKQDLDPEGILVARSGSAIVGALICMTTPGAGSLVWPPQILPDVPERTQVEDQLVRYAGSWLRRQGAKLAQTLLVPAEAYLSKPLERNGFGHVTTLLYLRLDLDERIAESHDDITFQPYPADTVLFGETLLQTYEATEDCPELTGVRTIDEIIEGHRVQGLHDPQRWWLAHWRDRPVGVLLLAKTEEPSSWDVSYVGVVSSGRRRGLGRQLMHKAIAEAKRGGAHQLTLSVDRRNRAAFALYKSLGFEQFEEREVLLAIWGDSQRRFAED